MKRFGVLALIAVLVLGLAVYFAACGGGGGSSNNNNTVTYSSPSQAASSSDSVTGALALSSVVGSSADLASGSIPAGYAPSRRAKALSTDAIAKIDPRLKAVVDKMVAELRNPQIKSALAKARSLKTMSVGPISATTITCSAGGTFTISGQDTSTSPNVYTEDTVDITFSNCKDTISMITTTYDYVTNGSLHAYHKQMLDYSSEITNVTATNLDMKTYENSVLSETAVLNGTFNSTDNVTSGRIDANGTFTVTASGSTFIFSFTNVSNVWTSSTDTTGTTDEEILNGSFSYSFSSGGTTFAATIALTNLDSKTFTDINSNEDWWINGSIGMTWSPAPTGGTCIPGTITITTAPGTPIHTPAVPSGGCPTSGTITINNATVQFGAPLGTEVTVTVGGTSQIFNDCYALGGSACVQ